MLKRIMNWKIALKKLPRIQLREIKKWKYKRQVIFDIEDKIRNYIDR